jgi:hypothetical protein
MNTDTAVKTVVSTTFDNPELWSIDPFSSACWHIEKCVELLSGQQLGQVLVWFTEIDCVVPVGEGRSVHHPAIGEMKDAVLREASRRLGANV